MCVFGSQTNKWFKILLVKIIKGQFIKVIPTLAGLSLWHVLQFHFDHLLLEKQVNRNRNPPKQKLTHRKDYAKGNGTHEIKTDKIGKHKLTEYGNRKTASYKSGKHRRTRTEYSLAINI